MGCKLNKQGFTLTELLVTIVILGIIIGMSFPVISNIQSSNNKRQYTVYASSLTSEAKVYVSSYGEDLFGHSPTGCAIITYDMLKNKKLAKDIEIDKVSCDTDNTYVIVKKINNRYVYSTYMGCGSSASGSVSQIDYIYPTADTPHIADSTLCGGSNASTISVDVVPNSGATYKKLQTAQIQIKSSTGIASNVNISYAWSNSASSIPTTGWQNAVFTIDGVSKQENRLDSGEAFISALSSAIYTPAGQSGSFYLHLKVNTLNDLYMNPWKQASGTNNIVSGEFKVDLVPPTAPTVKMYSWKNNSTQPNCGNVSGLTERVNGGSSTNYVMVCASGSTDALSGIKTYHWKTTGAAGKASGLGQCVHIKANNKSTISFYTEDNSGSNEESGNLSPETKVSINIGVSSKSFDIEFLGTKNSLSKTVSKPSGALTDMPLTVKVNGKNSTTVTCAYTSDKKKIKCTAKSIPKTTANSNATCKTALKAAGYNKDVIYYKSNKKCYMRAGHSPAGAKHWSCGSTSNPLYNDYSSGVFHHCPPKNDNNATPYSYCMTKYGSCLTAGKYQSGGKWFCACYTATNINAYYYRKAKVYYSVSV